MAEIRHLETRHDVIFFCRVWSDLDKISRTGAEWHVDCGDMAEIETRSRIPIWRTFGRIQWHVISELRVTLQGAATWWIHWHVIPEPRVTLQGRPTATWWIHCHDSHATLQGVRIPSAILKIIFRHILFIFVFLMQFGLWRVAAFVSSPIHLLCLISS